MENGRAAIYRITSEEKPEDPVFSVEYLDRSVNPFTDFYKFCNGKWEATHPIPADKPYIGASLELHERNQYILGKILEKCALEEQRDPVRKMLGDFYYSSMNTEKIEELKFKPLSNIMARIDSIQDKDSLIQMFSYLHSNGISCSFSLESYGDMKNSSIYALYLVQGGLSLPNRDYYLMDSFKDLRENYIKHLQKMFILFGFDDDSANSSAETVFVIEKRFAENSRRPQDLRDPEKNYNRMDIAALNQKFNGIDLKRYLSYIGLPNTEYVITGQPEFYENLGKMIGEVSISDWKIYLKWKVLHFASPYLHEEVFNEYFDFYWRKLMGTPEPEKRWKRCVRLIDRQIGEALGKIYVEQEFGADSKRRMEEMVSDLREVFTDRLKKLDWMSDETKQKALEKFSRFRAKIGYPNKFIDYSSIIVKKDDYIGNIMRSNAFEFRRQIDRINSPVDHELWEMTPPTVNAYFSPTDNEIVFPAGILQPPFFDPRLDDAVNYGATGGTIAHEITHGFDDQGRKFDAEGNLKEWWTKEDEEKFMSRAKKVVDLYGSFEVLPGLKVNGELTLGENIADLGGVSIAFEALERRLSRNPEVRKKIDGFTPEQRFFMGWAQGWRSVIRDEMLKMQVSDDPHSPDKLRAELPSRVHEKFDSVFGDYKTSDYKKYETIKIW